MEDTFSNESDSVISVGTPAATHYRNIHNTDPDFHQIKRAKKIRGHYVLEFYETKMINDVRIRNAVTGVWYRDDHPKCKYLVGSRQEDVFFKVHHCTGETEISGNKKNTILLFYDSPTIRETSENNFTTKCQRKMARKESETSCCNYEGIKRFELICKKYIYYFGMNNI